MQNSELFRRGIVVPRDDAAEAQLRRNDVSASTNVRFLPIADEAHFEALWHIGLYDAINRHCGTLLDDYEETIIEPALTGAMLSGILETIRGTPGGELPVLPFLCDLRELVDEAIRTSRPVVVVL